MNKEVIILVGSQGSGKSTFCLNTLPNHFRISQDEQGAKHLDLYKEVLATNQTNIVIDRINHTREQRYRYISLAKAAGYTTKIVELFEDYMICYGRMCMRKDHPTIKNTDDETIKKDLDMYFNQYEMIGDNEADIIIRSNSNPIVLDLTETFNKLGRAIVIGDLHGCFDELAEILTTLKYDQRKDMLISCGDLCDRGPKIAECLKLFLYGENCFAVQGNHDNKLIRYLKGNKVNPVSLAESIKQIGDDKDLINPVYYMSAMCHTIIKFGNNYVTHAGFHPNKHPEHTSREFSLYARKYDKAMGTFTNSDLAKYWYEEPKKYTMFNLFFGHEIHVDTCEVAQGIYAMDAGCYAGNKLRVAVVTPEGIQGIMEIDSKQPKTTDYGGWDFINKFEPYEKLVEAKYLNKQEHGDLVLYNYTDKCTYDKYWNKYTMECRGLILNKVTGDTVARPFPKFFNLGELESPALPDMPTTKDYEVYDKLDGSLGILYLDPSDNIHKIATRGSFKSDQAIKATSMWHDKVALGISTDEFYKDFIRDFPEYTDYTLLFEIIYPENRVNPGARLVCDYGNTEAVILLGAVHRVTGKDLDHSQLTYISNQLCIPVAKKFEYTIEQMIELKKTLSMTEEGFVVRWPSGFRMKIKGDEYCRMQKILNGINPLNIWDIMTESNKYSGRFEVPYTYKEQIPEEILPEVNEMEAKLKSLYSNVWVECMREYEDGLNFAQENFPEEIEKGLGIFSQKETTKHKSCMFLIHKVNVNGYKKYMSNMIRPKANKIGD